MEKSGNDFSDWVYPYVYSKNKSGLNGLDILKKASVLLKVMN
jgi:hypothetical protein